MLFKKAVRAIWNNKRSYIACVFLISIGIMLYMGMGVAAEGLGIAMEKFYTQYNLADVFAKVEAMPISAADILAEIPGVATAEARNVIETRVEVPGSDEIITLRLISMDTDNQLNQLDVTGNSLSDESDMLVNPAFFTAHGMSIGDGLTAFVDGRGYAYNVCGTAISPEYVYIARGGADMLPNATGFGIAYITSDSMSHLLSTAGVANEVVIGLAPGTVFDDVKIQLEDALTPYGMTQLIDKKDQMSYSYMQTEVQSINTMSSALPAIFIMMAAIVLYLMMRRVIEQDRTQIGTLKALGYSNLQVLVHYLSYGGITGFAGGLLGCVAGYALSGYYLSMFLLFFTLPGMSVAVNPLYVVSSFVISIGGGMGGAFFGVRKILKLSPADAMHPESPKPVKHDIVGSIKFLRHLLTSRGNMALRSITRNWMRSGFVVLGITFSFGLLAISGSFSSIMDKMILAQFDLIQVYGAKITLNQPLEYAAAVETAYAIDHVTRAEGFLELPAELKHRNLTKATAITGVEQNAALYRIADTNTGIAYPPPTDGLILSTGMAKDLQASAGDTVYISSSLLADDVPVKVARVVEQNLGAGCYMELSALCTLFEMPKTATSILFDTDDFSYIKDYLKGSQNTAAIEDKDTTLQKYQDMLGMYTSIYFFLGLMSMAVAFAIIYNTATISLSERQREYATLRVVGLTVGEVCEIMNFEYWVLAVVGMVLGVPFTFVLNNGLNVMMGSMDFSMPSSLPATAFITGVVGCAAAVMLSNFSAKRRIGKFDMVEVLKERE